MKITQTGSGYAITVNGLVKAKFKVKRDAEEALACYRCLGVQPGDSWKEKKQ